MFRIRDILVRIRMRIADPRIRTFDKRIRLRILLFRQHAHKKLFFLYTAITEIN